MKSDDLLGGVPNCLTAKDLCVKIIDNSILDLP